MTSINIVDKIYKSGKALFSTLDLRALLQIKSDRTFEDTIKRIEDSKVLIKLERGKYILSGAKVLDFEIAQFLYSPSYISFETALNFYGILAQFPFVITSATTKKSMQKTIDGKAYSYSKLNKYLYTGFYKEQGFLIAYPEKALFDQLYLIFKGFRANDYLNEMDYSKINIVEFNKYLTLVPKSVSNKLKLLIENYI